MTTVLSAATEIPQVVGVSSRFLTVSIPAALRSRTLINHEETMWSSVSSSFQSLSNRLLPDLSLSSVVPDPKHWSIPKTRWSSFSFSFWDPCSIGCFQNFLWHNVEFHLQVSDRKCPALQLLDSKNCTDKSWRRQCGVLWWRVIQFCDLSVHFYSPGSWKLINLEDSMRNSSCFWSQSNQLLSDLSLR